MLDRMQMVRARVSAHQLIDDLSENIALTRSNTSQANRNYNELNIGVRLHDLASELGFRLEPIAAPVEEKAA